MWLRFQRGIQSELLRYGAAYDNTQTSYLVFERHVSDLADRLIHRPGAGPRRVVALWKGVGINAPTERVRDTACGS